MDRYEYTMHRMHEIRGRIPSWAEAEGLKMTCSERELGTFGTGKKSGTLYTVIGAALRKGKK